MRFARFARTFCWNIVTFGANLCELFPDLRIRHSEIGEETSELARMNRFDYKTGQKLSTKLLVSRKTTADQSVLVGIQSCL